MKYDYDAEMISEVLRYRCLKLYQTEHFQISCEEDTVARR
jgi:hypothetical protein